VVFYPRYLGGPGLDSVVKHILHIVDVVGEDTPALGSDWDGLIVPTHELSDPGGLPLLTDALMKARVPARIIEKILRRNVMRLLSEA
jgi:membrane dipeptidase